MFMLPIKLFYTVFNIKVNCCLIHNLSLSMNFITIISASPLKATVYNDQNQFTFTYQINITEGTIPKTKHFNATTIVKSIGFTYEKVFQCSAKFRGQNIFIEQMRSIYATQATCCKPTSLLEAMGCTNERVQKL